MTPRTFTYVRRLALVSFFAAAATFSGSAAVDPAVACAAPREWDVVSFDNCMSVSDIKWAIGQMTDQEHRDAEMFCCGRSGGAWNGAICVAPTAEQAQEAEGAPPPLQPEIPGMTLYMPPPVGPVVPPPGQVGPPSGEAVLAP